MMTIAVLAHSINIVGERAYAYMNTIKVPGVVLLGRLTQVHKHLFMFGPDMG
jgi:hypothetical protein